MHEHDEFSEWLDEQSVERIQAAYERVERRQDWDDEEEFELALMQECYRLWHQDILGRLVDRGLAEASVCEDGDLGYSLTPDGRKAAEDALAAE